MHWCWRRLVLIGAALCVGLVGCKSGPNYTPVELPDAEHFQNASLPSEESPELSHWWTNFNDQQLTQLINTAARQNLSLQEAYYRVQEARARVGLVRGDLFPVIGGTADYARRKRSLNSRPFVSVNGMPFDFFSLGIDSSWEVDLFGKQRRMVEGATADYWRDVESHHDGQVTLYADVATTYVQLRLAQTLQRIARANLELQKKTVQVAKRRQKAGQVGRLDVVESESQLHATSAELPQVDEQTQLALNRLYVLLGQPPSDGLPEMLGNGEIPFPGSTLAIGVPADLIRRRPDVRRAEQEVIQANAQIGVALADYYPQLSLVGTISVNSRRVSSWFQWGSAAFDVGPSVRWNILQFGRVKSNVGMQQARHQRIAMAYRSAILRAIQEVEDGLVSYKRQDQRSQSLESAVRLSKESVRLSLQRYNAGLVTVQRVLDTQNRLMRTQQMLAISRANIVLSLIRIYKASGGGWQPVEAWGTTSDG